MRTSEEKIERFDRRSSGHRKLSENRRTRLCGYKAYSNSKNGHDEHEEDNSYYQNSRKNYKSPGARYKQRRSRSSLSPSSSRHSCHEIRDDEKGHLIYHFGNFIDKRCMMQTV
ncbi:hypothetical protein HZS_794 [Henneguya salminicola]|nr:hypothetical protein HZS_794 [Henneguya salminicola]